MSKRDKKLELNSIKTVLIVFDSLDKASRFPFRVEHVLPCNGKTMTPLCVSLGDVCIEEFQ
jgi:hypothetical protein